MIYKSQWMVKVELDDEKVFNQIKVLVKEYKIDDTIKLIG